MLIKRSSHFWRAFYDRVAFAYDAILRAGAWLRLGSEERIRREVIGKLDLSTASRVIEFGCGTLLNRSHLPDNIKYTGVDISRGMLRRAQVRSMKLQLGTNLVQADLASPPFASRTADASIAMGVLQHVKTPQEAIKQMERVTKTGGAIILIDERRGQKKIMAKGSADYKMIGEYFVAQYLNA